MTLEDARQRLVEAGYRINKEERLGNQTGTQLRLDGGPVVNVFDNGNSWVRSYNLLRKDHLRESVPCGA